MWSNPEKLVYNFLTPNKLIDRLIQQERTQTASEYQKLTPNQVYERYIKLLTKFGKENTSDLYTGQVGFDEDGNPQVKKSYNRQFSRNCPTIGIWSVNKLSSKEISLFSHKIIATQDDGQESIILGMNNDQKNLSLYLHPTAEEWYYHIAYTGGVQSNYLPKENELEDLIKLSQFLENVYKKLPTSIVERLFYNTSRMGLFWKAVLTDPKN